jgi:hypothetical protein
LWTRGALIKGHKRAKGKPLLRLEAAAALILSTASEADADAVSSAVANARSTRAGAGAAAGELLPLLAPLPYNSAREHIQPPRLSARAR